MYEVYLPLALQYGCGYELFWKLNPRKLESFRIAYKNKLEMMSDMIDILAWRIGGYNLRAIGNCFSNKNPKYPNKPDSQRDFAAEERKRIHDYMENHARYMREKRKEKSESREPDKG